MIYCGRRIPSNAQSISPCPNFTCVCALQPAEINQISLLYTCCDEPMENKLFDGKGIACAPSSRPHQSYVVSQSTLPITRLTMEQRLPWDVLSGLQLCMNFGTMAALGPVVAFHLHRSIASLLSLASATRSMLSSLFLRTIASTRASACCESAQHCL